MNYTGDFLEEFEAVLYACFGDDVEPSLYWDNDADQSRWSAMDTRERVLWFAGELRHCTAIMPGDICADLDVPQGSTYGEACMKILQGEISLPECE